MGFFDILFGHAPKVDKSKESTLTPEQQQALKQLIGSTSGFQERGPKYTGDLTVDPNMYMNTSLAGLEQRALQFGAPGGQNEQVGGALQDIITQKNSNPAETDKWFSSAVEDPALKDFREKILPTLSRNYGGSNFFGSDRQNAENYAGKNLVDTLTSQRASAQLSERQNSRQAAISAAGALTGYNTGVTGDLNALLQGGTTLADLQFKNISNKYDEFKRQQADRAQRIQEILAALGVHGVENVIATVPGDSGIVGNFLSSGGGQAAGTAMGCFLASTVYGLDNPRWIQFAIWKNTRAPKWLKRFYDRFSYELSNVARRSKLFSRFSRFVLECLLKLSGV